MNSRSDETLIVETPATWRERLYGSTFSLAAIVALVLYQLDTRPEAASIGNLVHLVIFVAVFTVFSLCLVFGRSILIANRSAGTLTVSRGIFIPGMLKTVYSWSDFHSVVLKFHEQPTTESDDESKLIGLLGKQQKFYYGTFSDLDKAIDSAQRLANFMQLPFRDEISSRFGSRGPKA